ncbi:MAG: ATP-binding protein [Candidatus Hydrogenedentes bacterium]|nr:ATP-binding protein [Candidatus Hydrogenedentota bacterium]
MTKPFFVEQFGSTMDAMGRVLQAALRALVEHGWVEPDQKFYAQLCLEEALVNAVDHGNKCDPAKKVRIEMVEENDLCTIRVYDEGGGFAPEDIHLPQLEQANGRGICLIRYCMERVTYNNECKCLEMRMRRKALSGRKASCE